MVKPPGDKVLDYATAEPRSTRTAGAMIWRLAAVGLMLEIPLLGLLVWEGLPVDAVNRVVVFWRYLSLGVVALMAASAVLDGRGRTALRVVIAVLGVLGVVVSHLAPTITH